MQSVTMTRRGLFATAAAAAAAGARAQAPAAAPTEFQIACMTLPYGAFTVERALSGIASAGYRYVAWGPHHTGPDGQRSPLLAETAPASAARELATRTRDLGLEPVMMFGVVYVEAAEAVDAYRRRIEQAAAARIPYVLAFGNTKGAPGERDIWVRNLKVLGPAARAAGVTIAIKQHGGTTATGEMCAGIVKDVADEGVKMFYDAGNNYWYSGVDPQPDMKIAAPYVRGFAIKDFRAVPKRTTCGPGFGEIDHYRLLMPVARTGLKMPLCFETIFAPYVARPKTPEGIDAVARGVREYMETVVAGLSAA
jgi:sugar phosphate isomerase/epimerase